MLLIWLIVLITFAVISAQIRMYQERHERDDGKGYPSRKAGEDIPFIARMICVADSFDAMNSNRVYRKKLTKEHILAELEENKGAQFDPKVVDVMLALLREGTISWDRD